MHASLKSRMSGIANERRGFATDLGSWMRAGAHRLAGVGRRRPAAELGAWVLAEGGVGDASLRAWPDSLDHIGREILGEPVARFGADFEIVRAGPVDGERTGFPALAATLRTLVTHYCLAGKAVVDADRDMVRFRRRRRWQPRCETEAPGR